MSLKALYILLFFFKAILVIGQPDTSSKVTTNRLYFVGGFGTAYCPSASMLFALNLGIDFEHYHHNIGLRWVPSVEFNPLGGDYRHYQVLRLHYGYKLGNGRFTAMPFAGVLYLRKTFFLLTQGGLFSDEELEHEKIREGSSAGITLGCTGQYSRGRLGFLLSLSGTYTNIDPLASLECSVRFRLNK